MTLARLIGAALVLAALGACDDGGSGETTTSTTTVTATATATSTATATETSTTTASAVTVTETGEATTVTEPGATSTVTSTTTSTAPGPTTTLTEPGPTTTVIEPGATTTVTDPAGTTTITSTTTSTEPGPVTTVTSTTTSTEPGPVTTVTSTTTSTAPGTVTTLTETTTTTTAGPVTTVTTAATTITQTRTQTETETETTTSTFTETVTPTVTITTTETEAVDVLPPYTYATTCDVNQDVASTTSVVAVDAFPELSPFTNPLQVVNAGDGSGRIFVVERGGRIMKVSGSPGAHTRTTFLDISDRPAGGTAVYLETECGFLSAAFHPDYEDNGYVYVAYCVREANQTYELLTRFTRDEDEDVLDEDSELEILRIAHPFDNHKGGWLGFGPDGYLYMTVGDGGSGNDPQGNGQNTNTLLGKILRLDVDASGGPGGTANYAAPVGNPYRGGGGRAEICAIGVRNPWRGSFDRQTGELWVGDVGQDNWEEVDTITCGLNYGWKIMEATHCRGGTTGCSTDGLTLPRFEYPRSGGTLNGRSVTGGHVYRGGRAPSLWGRYVFADFSANWVATWAPGEPNPSATLLSLGGIAGMGEDEAGELYLAALGSGRIYWLQDNDVGAGVTPPATLSATGCFDGLAVTSSGTLTPSTGVLPYELNVPFWSDGNDKQRFLVLPSDGKVGFGEDGKWTVPTATVLIKHFTRPNPNGGNAIRVETRFLVKEALGVRGFSYRWRASQTEADLVTGGATFDLPLGAGSSFAYTIPSSGACRACHRDANSDGGDGLLGLETRQMNRVARYAFGNAQQIEAWRVWDLFSADDVPEVDALPRHPALGDTGVPVEARARAWLDVNCAFCHQPDGPSGAAMDLRLATDFGDAALCEALPERGDLGIANARLLDPGSTATSILYERATRRDEPGMPPLGSALVDPTGAALLSAWIGGLTTCP